MGYTHYWKSAGFTPAQWKTLQFAARVIAERSKAAGAPLAGWAGKGQPTINGKAIRLNGVDPDSFETFALEPRASRFSFCKTGRRPYDAAVVALLIVAARINPWFSWTSDGDPGEHADGRTMARDLPTAGCTGGEASTER
jgi:hypothetical protein